MANRHIDVNKRGRDWINGLVSANEFFNAERQRAREIATRRIDARIAAKLASPKNNR